MSYIILQTIYRIADSVDGRRRQLDLGTLDFHSAKVLYIYETRVCSTAWHAGKSRSSDSIDASRDAHKYTDMSTHRTR